MSEYKDGYEYLDMLRQQNRSHTPSFQDFTTYLEGKAREQGVPMRGQFELTPLCNLSCKMCYVHLDAEKLCGRALLSTEQWKKIMRQAYDAGMLSATLTGGECLTYPGFDELYLYLQSLGCTVDIMTNGVLLGEERMRFFRAHPPHAVQITLYGNSDDAYERVTGSRVFHTVIENIGLLKTAGIPFIISITPNRYLGEDIFDTISTAWSLTENVIINTSLFPPSVETGRAESVKDPDAEYYARVRQFFIRLRGGEVSEREESALPVPGGPCKNGERRGMVCGGGRSGFTINWKGEMQICSHMPQKSFPMQEGFATAWQKIHDIANNLPMAPACKGCAYEKICGICAADAMKYARSGQTPVSLCRRTVYMASRGALNIPNCE